MSDGGAVPLRDAGRITSFCVRRVNPFRGLLAVVSTSSARALSDDGRNWQLEVRAHPPRGLWSGAGHQPGWRYYRFGAWSSASGLRRVPLSPIFDTGAMVEAAEDLIAAIQAQTPRLPFDLAEELELWLLDTARQPLAMLATSIDASPDRLNAIGRPPWRADACDPAERSDDPAVAQARQLEWLIQRMAGTRSRAQWLCRDPTGAVCRAYDAAPLPAGARRAAAALPVLPLRASWPPGPNARLIGAYLRRLAPFLLTLPTIDDGLRARLERDAAADAPTVARCWRLYPKIIDTKLLRRCRVEARLRENGKTAGISN